MKRINYWFKKLNKYIEMGWIVKKSTLKYFQITFEFNRLTIVFNISPYFTYKLSYTQVFYSYVLFKRVTMRLK